MCASKSFATCYVNGTSGRGGASFALLLRLGKGSLRLAWPNWRGFVYRVQSADYAIGPWTEQAVVEPGQYQTSWETKSEFADVRFYRVLAELEP